MTSLILLEVHAISRGLDYSEAPSSDGREVSGALQFDVLAAVRRAEENRRAGHLPAVPHWVITLGCFALLIVSGSILLSMPGVLKAGRLSAPDAVLLAASAATLTGLSAVSASDLSPQGQALLLILFQSAGIAIITFSTMYLAVPGIHYARNSRRLVRQRWLEVEQVRPGRLLRDVVLMTLALEAAGALVLYLRLRALGLQNPTFSAVFLAASAFCNAGFAPGEPGVAEVAGDTTAMVALMALVSLGALGYIVLRDIIRRVAGAKKSLDLHTKIVLLATLILICSGAAFLFVFGPFTSVGTGAGPRGLLASLFHAVNARTAGFALPGRAQSSAANVLTVLLMLVGGASGSTAGGLKITTVFMALLIGLKGMNPKGSGLLLTGRRAPQEAVEFAAVFVLRALLLLTAAALLLAATETLFNHQVRLSFGQLLFETVSAFTATGLSSGLTSVLSTPGKAVVVLTMLTGRFGLLAMVAQMSAGRRPRETREVLRQGEVIVG